MARMKKVGPKKSNKNQGEMAKAKAASATNQNPVARTMGRGMGSSYAYAVDNLLDQAKHMKGSDNGFLGEPKETLDPTQFSHSLLKNKK